MFYLWLYRHFLNVLSLRILSYFICIDIRLELLSLPMCLIFFLNELSFSMLSYIYFNGHSFSFIVSFCIIRLSTADVRSFTQAFFGYIFFLLLCWSFGTNWRERGRYCRCVGGSVSPCPSTTVLDSVAPCGGMTLWSAPI